MGDDFGAHFYDNGWDTVRTGRFGNVQIRKNLVVAGNVINWGSRTDRMQFEANREAETSAFLSGS